MLSRGYSPKTHSGLDSLIHNILVKDLDILKKEEAAVFSKLKARREQADYETGFMGSEEEFQELRTDAKELVESLKDTVDGKSGT